MVIYLHNICSKMPDKGEFTISVTKIGSIYFEIGWHKIKIKVCPFCGKNGKTIVKEYFKS